MRWLAPALLAVVCTGNEERGIEYEYEYEYEHEYE